MSILRGWRATGRQAHFGNWHQSSISPVRNNLCPAGPRSTTDPVDVSGKVLYGYTYLVIAAMPTEIPTGVKVYDWVLTIFTDACVSACRYSITLALAR